MSHAQVSVQYGHSDYSYNTANNQRVTKISHSCEVVAGIPEVDNRSDGFTICASGEIPCTALGNLLDTLKGEYGYDTVSINK